MVHLHLVSRSEYFQLFVLLDLATHWSLAESPSEADLIRVEVSRSCRIHFHHLGHVDLIKLL